MQVKQIVSSKIAVFALVALLALLANLRYRQYKSEQAVIKLKQDLQSQVATQQKRSQDLQDSIEYLKSEDFKDKVAREQLNLKKDGELVYNFSQNNDMASEQKPVDSRTNAQKWWQYFFSK